MNVVDSNAWLEYFAGDPNASIFSGPIAKRHDATVWTQDADFEQLSGVRYRPRKS